MSNNYLTDSHTDDLPYSLVHDCCHFLNLQSRVVEFRRKAANIWRSTETDWRLNMNTWTVTRSTRARTVKLVNYRGRYYYSVLQTFRDFESFRHIIIFQPEQGALEVELRRLELKFFLNANGLFESQKLHCEIAVNQNAGCLYGLKSVLLIQDVKNPVNRSVLVPLGAPLYRKWGIHVEVKIKYEGKYARYGIDHVLGRLTSAAQPRLLYFKALIHALTSFILPDPLTQQTGTEAAMHFLSTGLVQPSSPLSSDQLADLRCLRAALPLRTFYPKDLQCMEEIEWNPALTMTIQHDGLLKLVEDIFDASNKLCALFPNSTPEVYHKGQHSRRLATRAVVQRARFERANVLSENIIVPVDKEYDARHFVRHNLEHENVSTLTNLIRTWPSHMQLADDYYRIFEEFKRLGGFKTPFAGLISLSSCMSIDDALSLGSVTSYCQRATYETRYELMIVIALAAYKRINMDVFKFWLAFAFFDKLKQLRAPGWDEYFQFQKHQHPQLIATTALINNAVATARLNNGTSFSTSLVFGSLDFQLPTSEAEDSIVISIDAFAQHLVAQFPVLVPIGEPYTHVLDIPVRTVLAVIKPEFLRLYQNLELSQFLDEVHKVLKEYRTDFPLSFPGGSRRSRKSAVTWSSPKLVFTTLSSLFKSAKAVEPVKSFQTPRQTNGIPTRSARSILRQMPNGLQSGRVDPDSKPNRTPISFETKELGGIFERLAKSDSKMMQQYIMDLNSSLTAFCEYEKILKDGAVVKKKWSESSTPLASGADILASSTHATNLLRCHVGEAMDRLQTALLVQYGLGFDWLMAGGLFPCISTVSLLEQLRSHCGTKSAITPQLIHYGISLTNLQRQLRIVDGNLKGKTRKVNEEMKNEGHENWSPSEYPDWLLLELDSNLLIRDEQVIVAKATINPQSGQNSLLQMNMGQVRL